MMRRPGSSLGGQPSMRARRDMAGWGEENAPVAQRAPPQGAATPGGRGGVPAKAEGEVWSDAEALTAKGSSLNKRNALLVAEVVRLREVVAKLQKSLADQRRVHFAEPKLQTSPISSPRRASSRTKMFDGSTQTDDFAAPAAPISVADGVTQTSRGILRSRTMSEEGISISTSVRGSPISVPHLPTRQPSSSSSSASSDESDTGESRDKCVDGQEEETASGSQPSIRGRQLFRDLQQRAESPSLSPTSPHTPYDPHASQSSNESDPDELGASGEDRLTTPYPLKREGVVRTARLSLQRLPEPYAAPSSAAVDR